MAPSKNSSRRSRTLVVRESCSLKDHKAEIASWPVEGNNCHRLLVPKAQQSNFDEDLPGIHFIGQAYRDDFVEFAVHDQYETRLPLVIEFEEDTAGSEYDMKPDYEEIAPSGDVEEMKQAMMSFQERVVSGCASRPWLRSFYQQHRDLLASQVVVARDFAGSTRVQTALACSHGIKVHQWSKFFKGWEPIEGLDDTALRTVEEFAVVVQNRHMAFLLSGDQAKIQANLSHIPDGLRIVVRTKRQFPDSLNKHYIYIDHMEGWHKLCHAPRSYQMFEDIEKLTKACPRVIQGFPDTFALIVLGVGDATKLKIVLDETLRQKKRCICKLVDISPEILETAKTLAQEYPGFQYVLQLADFHESGDVLQVDAESYAQLPRYIISFGASFMNGEHPDQLLSGVRTQLRDEDLLHVSLDGYGFEQQDEEKILGYYDQPEAWAFMKQAVRGSLGFDESSWTWGHKLDARSDAVVHCYYVENETGVVHEFFHSWKHRPETIENACRMNNVQVEVLDTSTSKMVHYIISTPKPN